MSFEAVWNFEWSEAYLSVDARQDYGEKRYQALGPIGETLHMLVFTRRGAAIHVISLRKANRREVKRYEQTTRS